jgi:PAS domain S-box-containing protein
VIFNQDKALRYTWIHNPNPAFSAEDIIGKTDSDLLPPEGAAPLIEVKQRVLDTGERTREEVNTPIGDEIFTYDLTVEPLLDSNDNIIGVSCAALEITELKQTQKALQQARDELEQRVVLLPKSF